MASEEVVAEAVEAVEPFETTADALLRGRLPLAQPARGYRTNVDALLLASFARREKPATRCLDLGAGVGAVGLALVVMGRAERTTLLDLDASVLALATANARAAGIADRAETLLHDLRVRLPSVLGGAFDLVVANPPYGVEGRTRPAADPSRAVARAAPAGTLVGFVRAARAALGRAGRFCVVFPTLDLGRLFDALRASGLEPKRLRFVHPLAESPGRLALVEAKAARAGGLRVESPLVLMSAPGVATEEARRITETL